MAFVTYTLAREGLIHTDTLTAGADSMDAWIGNPELHGDELVWKPAEESADIDMLRPASDPFLRRRRDAAGPGQSRPRRVQDQRGRRGALADRGAGALLLRPERGARSVQGGRARPRRRGHRPLPGTARQRHARAAQADPDAGRAPGPRPQGRARSPTAACRARAARCRPRSTSRPKRCPTGRWRGCATATSIRLDARAGTLEAVGVDLAARPPANSPPPPVGHRPRAVRADADARRARRSKARRRCSTRWRRSRHDGRLAVADVGGTHARFAMAEIEGGRVRLARRAGDAQDRRACELPDSPGRSSGAARASTLPDELAIAFAGPVGGEVLKLTNNPWVIRPALIKERLGVDRYTIVNDFGAVAYAVATLGDERFPPYLRARAAASRRRRDQHRRTGHRASASPRCSRRPTIMR